MEFDTNGFYNGKQLDMPLHRVFPEKITVLEADALGRLPPRTQGVLEAVIDDLGQRSAKAQGLGAVITTVRKMMYTDQRIYIHRTDRAINGLLKVGRKNLFIRDHQSGKMHEINPLCVLDFYVHESVQRGGIGKLLFEEMLRRERLEPHEFGYDRPSPKLIGFLRKHYGLTDFDPQPNNFVVFKAYFNKAPSARGPAAAGQRLANSRRRANQGAQDFAESHGPGEGTGDGGGGWQRAQRGNQSSNSFFLGGPGMSDARSRNAQIQPAHERSAGAVSDMSGMHAKSADAQQPLGRGSDEASHRMQLHDGFMPPLAPASAGAPVGAGGNGTWTSKLSALAGNVPHDSLSEFARARHGSGDSSQQRGGSSAPASSGWETRPAQRQADLSAPCRDKSLQEEASHAIYGGRRPGSGRRALASLMPGQRGGSNFAGEAAALGVGDGGTGGHHNMWRTANSEIGGWNQKPGGGAGAGAGGLGGAALNDRRVGGRLW